MLIDAQSTIALVFFVTYTLSQPPATVLCRKIGPRPFLATICLLWGAVMIGFGFVTVWTQMIALRVVLGLFEAGFFPGCVYLLSTWYARCMHYYVLLGLLLPKLIFGRRHAKKILGLLFDWLCCIRISRNSRFWDFTDGKSSNVTYPHALSLRNIEWR